MIEESAGYKSLLAAVEKDYAGDRRFQEGHPPFHNYRAKLDWAVERAKAYGVALNMDPAKILDAWEDKRDYWYMNYYQDAKQPLIEDGVRVFETSEDLRASVGDAGFRCPACSGVSKSPYECTSGLVTGKGKSKKVCDWKSYGLFGSLGKGAKIFVKANLAGDTVFMPIAWETPT